jgi:hypothetical protein
MQSSCMTTSYCPNRATYPTGMAGAGGGVGPATVIVPTFGGAGYSTLQHNVNVANASCVGYFNLNNAYGTGVDCCNPSYIRPLCQKTCSPQLRQVAATCSRLGDSTSSSCMAAKAACGTMMPVE